MRRQRRLDIGQMLAQLGRRSSVVGEEGPGTLIQRAGARRSSQFGRQAGGDNGPARLRLGQPGQQRGQLFAGVQGLVEGGSESLARRGVPAARA